MVRGSREDAKALEDTMSRDSLPTHLLLASTLSLAVSCGPKSAPPPAAEAPPTAAHTVVDAPKEAPPPASPLTLEATELVGAPELPLLSGAVRSLDMVTLTTSTQSFTIEADTTMFDASDYRVAARLQLAFQFDPRWRVGLWEGQSVAWARQADPHGWVATWGGYRRTDTHTIRTLFRFEPRPSGHVWSQSGLVARNGAGSRSMQVMAWKVDRGAWEGQMAAAFTIDGTGMSLEVHEMAPQLTLAGTQRDLQQATLRTKAIADQVARGHLQRTSLAMVPAGEPRLGNPFVNVTPGPGTLDIRGRVNPQRMGWTWVRVLDSQGIAWEENLVALSSAERIGWDANEAVVSYFQSTIPAVSTPPAAGTVEVWFVDDETGKIRRVGAFPFGPDVPPAG